MKKTVFLFATLFYLCSYAQPVYESTKSASGTSFIGETVNLTDDGIKSIWYNSIDTILELRNADGSLFRNVKTPQNLYWDYFLMSNKLFDNDSQIEYLIYKTQPNNNAPVTDRYKLYYLINESGSIKYSFPDTLFNASSGDRGRYFLYRVGLQYKLTFYGYKRGTEEVDAYITYNLPGNLPCDACGLSGIIDPGSPNDGMNELRAYPNPFNGTLRVEYKLHEKEEGAYLALSTIDGKEVRRIVLGNISDHIDLNTQDLPKGIIMASIYGRNGNLITKKVVKVD